jgi:hypothetical protein
VTREPAPTVPYGWSAEVLRAKAKELDAAALDMIRVALDLRRIADEIENPTKRLPP